MKIKILGGLLVAALTVTSVAGAQTRTPVINHREHRQERRINHGVRNGELTKTRPVICATGKEISGETSGWPNQTDA